MPIDRIESRRRAAEHFANIGKPYASTLQIAEVADFIQQAAKDTALECSEICRRHSDRAPGGLIPVGAAARASDEIRFLWGLAAVPAELQCAPSECQLCGGMGLVSAPLTEEQIFRGVVHVSVACPRCLGSVTKSPEAQIAAARRTRR